MCLKVFKKTRWFTSSLERFETVLHYLYFENVVNSAERFGTVLHYLQMRFVNSVKRFETVPHYFDIDFYT